MVLLHEALAAQAKGLALGRGQARQPGDCVGDGGYVIGGYAGATAGIANQVVGELVACTTGRPASM